MGSEPAATESRSAREELRAARTRTFGRWLVAYVLTGIVVGAGIALRAPGPWAVALLASPVALAMLVGVPLLALRLAAEASAGRGLFPAAAVIGLFGPMHVLAPFLMLVAREEPLQAVALEFAVACVVAVVAGITLVLALRACTT